MPQPTFYPPAGRRSGGRVAALVAAGVIGLLSLGLLAAGGVLLWGGAQRDADGFLSTGVDRFATATYALTSASLDLDTGAPDWLVGNDELGTIRLRVSPHAGKEAFVGIAPTRAVDAYLRHTAHATVHDLSYGPFSADYRRHGGEVAPAPPTAQPFWVASAHGAGTRTLTWDVRRGRWSVVVMNADGSPGIDAGVSAGARVTFLTPAGWGALSAGTVLALAAGAVLALTLRRRPPDRQPLGPAPAVA